MRAERSAGVCRTARASCGVTLLLLAAAFGGCATVPPWQRDYLAEPAMQFDAEGLAPSFERQYYFSREAARGGQSFGGTGCGCN